MPSIFHYETLLGAELRKHEEYRRELSDSVNQKITKIVNTVICRTPAELAEAYLERKETFPLPLRSKFLAFVKFPSKAWKPNTPKPVKAELRKFLTEFKDGFLEAMKVKIGSDIMKELEKNYDKKTIHRIQETLIDFENFLSGARNALSSEMTKEAVSYRRNKSRRAIKSADILLKEGELSASEKETIEGIKSKFQDHLELLTQVKEVTVDPIKETLLYYGASGSLLGSKFMPEEWAGEYLYQYHRNFIFKKPQGKPKKIVFNALVIVIFKLLKRRDKQIKWLYGLTADIINQCSKDIGKKLTVKDIDNALHST